MLLFFVGQITSFISVAAEVLGDVHDSRVLKESTLWTAFEENTQRPFPGAVILGASVYTCNSWLIPSFRGYVQGARFRFNEAHKKTRSPIVRANYFYPHHVKAIPIV